MSTASKETLPEPLRKVADDDGVFRRQVSSFRQVQIKPEDAQDGRYILYICLGCPWACRTAMLRSLKGLEERIQLSILHHSMGPEGWYWAGEEAEAREDKVDPIQRFTKIKELYHSVDPSYSARFTVPVLFDTKMKTIVNNESSEIIRILNDWPGTEETVDTYPEDLRKEIDEVNEWTYSDINNRTYMAGFATIASEYQKHGKVLFESFQRADDLLSGTQNGGKQRKFLCGPGEGVFTEADIRLYGTIARFDLMYGPGFRLFAKRIRDYPHLQAWLRRCYEIPSVKKWTDFDVFRKAGAGFQRRPADKELILLHGPTNEAVLGY